MVATHSPHGDAGGTLHFPSPTHIHHVDPTSAFRQLRRSLSRSPSKGPTFRLITSKSTSPSPSSPLSPPLLSPPNRSVSDTLLSNSPVAPPSPLAIPYPLSARQNRPVPRRLSPLRMGSRSASAQRQRSPCKRTLSDSKDHGNATPRSSGVSSDDIENRIDQNVSPLREKLPERDSKSSGAQTPELTFAPHRTLTRVEKGNGSFGLPTAKSSPLKRSDGIMNLDQASLGSPSAKRRSLHGGIFSSDFNIFDHEAEFENQYDGSRMDTTPSSEYAGIQSPLPRRTSSLRKTTLQQRHEKPNFARSKPNLDLASDFTNPGQAVPKSRFRMSLDNFLPSMPRDSPFSSQRSLPNASAHPMSQQNHKPQASGDQPQPPRHPLSRSLTQSSSNSSMAEDSPTHIPIRQPEHRKIIVDFSKSMPLGSARPVLHEPAPNETSSQASTEASFATPENYKLAKPLPAAFMSTGLISKRNRHLDDTQTDFRSSTDQMPDTPCKRHSIASSATPAAPEIAISKTRHVRHSFGTPSTPFSAHVTRPAPGTFGKGVSVFGSGFAHGSSNRRGSFLGVDVDDQGQSTHGKGDSQSSVDFELPPTPTKQVLVPGSAQPVQGVSTTLGQATATSNYSISPSNRPKSPQQDQNCKLFPIGTLSGSADGDSDSLMDGSPAALRFRSLSSVPRSLTQSRLLRNSKSPAPLKTFHTAPSLYSRKSQTKRSPLLPASPIHDRFDRISPHTPREHVIPPDPSSLSISGQGNLQTIRPMDDMTSSPTTSSFVPATPTTCRESFQPFGKSRSSINSSILAATVDVDPSLTSRFDKVDLIGTGEFSSVFRVTKAQEDKNAGNYFALPAKRTPPRTPLPDRVWAVKKTRHPYIGPKDRQRKLQEVNILKALGKADHTVNLFDSWEDSNHLYIQTEFCEEGSLKVFLDEVGQNARLDDFRIWKIMLELSLGLKHIHSSGFIHLDLKPANVLITFEGVLKIGDFGMAAKWPAQPGIDGEGDREYIGPEILMGQYDKPADVFALGLIMLEIAGNVMLPDNGASWQRLRTGDMSDVPSLTWSSEDSKILRDLSGKPLSNKESLEEFYGSDSGNEDFGSPNFLRCRREQQNKGHFQLQRSGELAEPPAFMIDANNQEALDNIVRWMISPLASDRPIVDQILQTAGVQWAEARRRGGATIYEGNWGPADEVLADDAEMIDV